MTEQTIEEKVQFIMGLNKGITLDSIKDGLVDEGVEVLNYLKHIRILICQTGAGTYEAMFQTKLKLDPSQAGQGGYTKNGFRELSPAKVPKLLEDKVYAVYLNKVHKVLV